MARLRAECAPAFGQAVASFVTGAGAAVCASSRRLASLRSLVGNTSPSSQTKIAMSLVVLGAGSTGEAFVAALRRLRARHADHARRARAGRRRVLVLRLHADQGAAPARRRRLRAARSVPGAAEAADRVLDTGAGVLAPRPGDVRLGRLRAGGMARRARRRARPRRGPGRRAGPRPRRRPRPPVREARRSPPGSVAADPADPGPRGVRVLDEPEAYDDPRDPGEHRRARRGAGGLRARPVLPPPGISGRARRRRRPRCCHATIPRWPGSAPAKRWQARASSFTSACKIERVDERGSNRRSGLSSKAATSSRPSGCSSRPAARRTSRASASSSSA